MLALSVHFRFHLDLPKLSLIPSLTNIAIVIFNHFMWLSYFFKNNHPLWEVVSFYFFIIWAAPISIAISYSTSEVLPGLCNNNDFIFYTLYNYNFNFTLYIYVYLCPFYPHIP